MAASTRIRFGAFEFDSQRGELRKHGVRLKVQDQPLKVLSALLENPGEIVTRAELQQRIWGNDTFVDFEHGLSAAVNRLRDALSDSAENPRYVETVARRGYRFIAPVEPEQASPEPVVAKRRSTKLVWPASGLLIAVVVTGGLWHARREIAPPRLTALTALSGMEAEAAFSPDGRQVAFAWNGEGRDNKDIYVKLLGSETELRLTTHPAEEAWPSWSPDGSLIAFVSRRETPGVYVVSPLGGPERKLADVFTLSRPAWTPDGRFLVVARARSGGGQELLDGALYLVPAGGGAAPRPIAVPPAGSRYSDPAIGADGRLAFVVSGADPNGPGRIHILKLNGEALPEGDPKVIAIKDASISGLRWSADGRFLVYSSYARSGGFQTDLYRVATDGAAEAELIDVPGLGAMNLDPDVDPKNGRLAFSRVTTQADIWRWQRGGAVSSFLRSSLREANPQFSSDGSRIVFESARSGEESAIWIANADGTGWTRVTKGLSPKSGTPRWSPDDRWIVFDSVNRDGHWDVWKVEAAGGPPRRLTSGEGNNLVPSWSRDGKWVYFCSNRSGRDEIWRIPAGGGSAQQVTKHGGRAAFESADGKALYFTRSEDGAEGLFRTTLAGGNEERVIDTQIVGRGFELRSKGIYFITPQRRGPAEMLAFPVNSRYYLTTQALPPSEIRLYEFATGRIRVIGEIGLHTEIGFAVSPDEETFLCTGFVPEADLWMIENFR